MISSRWSIGLATLLCLTLPLGEVRANPSTSETNICPPSLGSPALDRVQIHTIAQGETLEAIAQQYNLKPATIIGMNPILQTGQFPVGTQIRIPPFDGIEIRVEPGQTWSDLEETYQVPGAAIFDNNGCLLSPPEVVFIPGVIWSEDGSSGGRIPVAPAGSQSPTPEIEGYPLAVRGEMILGYGNTRQEPQTGQLSFHSGIDFKAPIGTAVLATDDGVVAFAGDRGAYGNLVVINHANGKQTRYAHLGILTVMTGEQVQRAQQIGTLGYSGNPDSNEPHLHFEVRSSTQEGWVAQNPEPYLRSQILTP